MSPQEGKSEEETVAATKTAGPSASPGMVIGPYSLTQSIGEGGMGEVWLADQKQPVRRRVAIKLIKVGMDTREVMARFDSERQALALMDHPAIAKVFDAGSTPQGRPYFVMEYVAGLPITDYCDRHKLSVDDRLELFMRVCEGVQHAHQKAIIHRDLKPSNILITEVDGRPAPRIIDFGVAKATSQRLSLGTMLTLVGSVVGTPGYMSPEQADSGGEDIDTRTDVYSLGVVLYELLTGAQPLDLKKLSFAELLRKLREDDPPAPSTRLRTRNQSSSTAAENRGADPPTLVKQMRGDLDAITLKALEKKRSARYGSPMELAADIGRYLRNEPVLACGAGLSYRARKYIRRHRLGAAVAAAALVVIIFFGVAQTVALRRAMRERDRANRITNFMTTMFKVSDPSQARGAQITAREILDKAATDIEHGLANDPELQAQLMSVMGIVYDNLGLYPRAHALLERSVDIRRRVLGPDNRETLASMSMLASVLLREGRYGEAERLFRETIDAQRRELGSDNPDTLASMSNLGWALKREGKYAEAENIERETLAAQRRVLGPDREATLNTETNLAAIIYDQRRYVEAEGLEREALQSAERLLGPEHPNTLVLKSLLGQTLRGEGRYAEAEKLHRETLEARRHVLGPEHPETLASMQSLALVLLEEGRYSEVESLEREVRDIRRRVLGPEHPDTAAATYNLGCVEAREGKKDEALALVREAVDHGLTPTLDNGIDSDPDLVSLHGDPRFASLVAHAKERAAVVRAARTH